MHWIVWIVLGILAGAIARWLVPGAASGGLLMDLIIGLVGAVIGGWLCDMFVGASSAGANATGGGFLWSLISSVIGAVVLLLIIRLFQGSRSRTTI